MSDKPDIEFIFPGEIRVNTPGDYVLFADHGQLVGWRRVDPVERYRKLRDLLRRSDTSNRQAA